MEIYEDLFNPSFLSNATESRPALPKDAAVTMAYIPLQTDLEAYSDEKALDKGTLFPSLSKPFKGRMVKK